MLSVRFIISYFAGKRHILRRILWYISSKLDTIAAKVKCSKFVKINLPVFPSVTAATTHTTIYMTKIIHTMNIKSFTR